MARTVNASVTLARGNPWDFCRDGTKAGESLQEKGLVSPIFGEYLWW